MPARRRRISLGVAALAGVVAMAGCAPAHLDAQQQQAEAKECASLLERHVVGNLRGKIVVDDQTIGLGSDPAGFYRQLEAARGPDDFSFAEGKALTSQRASYISDLCKAKDASSLKSSSG